MWGLCCRTILPATSRLEALRSAEQSKELWDWMMDMNLNGPRHCVRAVINHMIDDAAARSSCFSVAAIDGLAGNSDYSAAKAA